MASNENLEHTHTETITHHHEHHGVHEHPADPRVEVAKSDFDALRKALDAGYLSAANCLRAVGDAARTLIDNAIDTH